MAWEVDSRTIAELWGFAKEQVCAWASEDLEVCWAEVQAGKDSDGCSMRLDMELYESKLAEARGMDGWILAQGILEFMEQHRTSDNGGWQIHVCPFGCHRVHASRTFSWAKLGQTITVTDRLAGPSFGETYRKVKPGKWHPPENPNWNLDYNAERVTKQGDDWDRVWVNSTYQVTLED